MPTESNPADVQVPEKMFPLMPNRRDKAAPGPLSIPWSVAEKAYGVYASRYGRGQTLKRLAERGGFGVSEMDEMYPPWREEVDEITKLRELVVDLVECVKAGACLNVNLERRVAHLTQKGQS